MTYNSIDPKSKHYAAFMDFHEANPHVYDEIVSLSKDIHAIKPQWSIQAVIEVLRWQSIFDTTHPDEDYKLNNNYNAFYARLVMENEPDLEGFFQLRGHDAKPEVQMSLL